MLAPYKRPPKPPRVGLLSRAGNGDGPVLVAEYESVGGELREDYVSRVPQGVRLYCARSVAKHYVRQGVADALTWNHVIVQLIAKGRRVTVLPDTVCELHCLAEWRDWLAHYGAAPTSVVGASLSLIRATLHRPLYVSRGSVPPVATVIGGRIEAAVDRGWYGACEVWDIQAAYARALASLQCDGVWKEGTTAASNRPAFVVARVTLPEREWGPLPERTDAPVTREERRSWIFLQARRDYPSGGVIEGIWSREELEAAESYGAQVEPLQTYVLYASSRQPFAGWWEAIQVGRRMHGAAGELAKMTGNTAWGAFAIAGHQSLVYYRDRKRFAQRLPFNPPPYRKAYDIAEQVTGSIRAKVFREFMVPAGDKLISVSTDGGLTFPGFTPTGEGWRQKDKGTTLCFVTPYVYAYRHGDGRPVFKCAGVPEPLRRNVFRAIAADTRVWNAPYKGNPSERMIALHRMRQFFPDLKIERTDAEQGAALIRRLYEYEGE